MVSARFIPVIAPRRLFNLWRGAQVTIHGEQFVRVRRACRVLGLSPNRELARLRASKSFGLKLWRRPGRRPVLVLSIASARVWLGLGVDDRRVTPRVQRLLGEAQRDVIRALTLMP